MKIKLSLNGRVVEQRKVKRESQFVMTCPILHKPTESLSKSSSKPTGICSFTLWQERQPPSGVST
jgi:hypothetical protein